MLCVVSAWLSEYHIVPHHHSEAGSSLSCGRMRSAAGCGLAGSVSATVVAAVEGKEEGGSKGTAKC